ncbi:TcaA NTF2-like domain-containing protein [Halobacillus campisalis]|uniref:Zinc-ribbon domain-containing protein n=1 Tax=Halobacillus campisalis TaxID=435909 RepID=A0ABW2K0Z6_9BACI|nr:zinc-ribbon domain-containing protein [Halobacillus campisalis]
MKYCTHCGEPLSEDLTFCTACGTKQEGDQVPSPQSERKQRVPKKPMSRKRKFTLLSVFLAVGLLIGAHFMITNWIDPLKTVQAMDRAMTEQDADGFFEQMELKDDAVIHKEEYLEYIEGSDWESIRYQLSQEFEDNSNEPFDFAVRDYDGNKIFNIKKNTIVPGLYHSYTIEGIPNQVTAATNMENTTFTFEDQTVELKEEEKYVDVALAYPGQYEVNGAAENAFGEFEYTDTIDVYPNNANESEVNVTFASDTVTVDTNQEDAVLFINGESTEKTLGEYEELGPFPDEEVMLHAEWKDEDGEVHKSEEMNQDTLYWGALSFHFEEENEDFYASDSEQEEESVEASAEEEKEEEVEEESEEASEEEESLDEDLTVGAEDHVLDFRVMYEDALNYRDYSIVSFYLESGSDADEELEEYVGDLEDKGFDYDFTLNEILSSEMEDEETVTVTTNEQFIFTNHEGDQTHYDRVKEYTVINSEDGFKITKIDIDDTERNEM